MIRSVAERVTRYDFARLDAGKRTPQGFLRAESNPTSTGIFPYRRRDGKIVRELRPPDEVFRDDSLATLRGAPVTDLHPTEMVKPSNARSYTVGFTEHDVRRDESDRSKVAATHTIFDARMIEGIERRDRVEVSCGYACDFEQAPGRYDASTGEYGPHVTTGQRYDGVQRNIVYNHVAIGPRNWGRQGPDVRLKLDAEGALELGEHDGVLDSYDGGPDGPPQPHLPSAGPDSPTQRGIQRMENMITIRIDGVDYEVPKASAPHIAKAIDTRDSTVKQMTTERDIAQGRADAADKSLSDVTTKLAEVADPKRIDALVTERSALVTRAAKVLGEDFRFDGLSARAVHEAALKKLDEKIDLQGRSDDYVTARFDAAIDTASADSKRRVRSLMLGTRVDIAQDDDDDDDDREDDDVPDYQKPLAVSLDRR